MEPFTYLFIDLFITVVFFVFSFHPGIRFNRFFSSFFKASLLVMIPFLIWDIWFQSLQVWWFNERYLMGIKLFSLPVEEVLFFVCMPFSWIFVYFCLEKFIRIGVGARMEQFLIYTLVATFFIWGMVEYEHIYSCFTFLTASLTLLFLNYSQTEQFIGKATLVYLLILLGVFPIYGAVMAILGSTEPILLYNPEHYLQIKFGMVWIEELVYWYELFLWNLFFFKMFAGDHASLANAVVPTAKNSE